MFLTPNNRNRRPPGFVTLAPSVSSFEIEGIAVPYIFTAFSSPYGGSQYHRSYGLLRLVGSF